MFSTYCFVSFACLAKFPRLTLWTSSTFFESILAFCSNIWLTCFATNSFFCAIWRLIFSASRSTRSHTLIVEEMHCLWLKRLPLLYYLKQEFLYNCSLRLWRENKNDLAWRVWNPCSPYKSVGRMFHNKLLISCPNAHCKTFCLLFSSDSLVLIILPSLRQNDRCDLHIHCGLWDIFGIRIFYRWRTERLHSFDYNYVSMERLFHDLVRP